MAKMGRPSANPKTETINFRLTKEDKQFLHEYSKQTKQSLTDLFKQFVETLKQKK